MSYADYAYYTDSYGGKAVSQEDFLRLAAKASAYLDNLTFGRAAGNADESVGSWSYTLASSSEGTSESVMVRAICRAWLPAEWLYRGVARE